MSRLNFKISNYNSFYDFEHQFPRKHDLVWSQQDHFSSKWGKIIKGRTGFLNRVFEFWMNELIFSYIKLFAIFHSPLIVKIKRLHLYLLLSPLNLWTWMTRLIYCNLKFLFPGSYTQKNELSAIRVKYLYHSGKTENFTLMVQDG